jgi:hypothetical protein
MASFKSPQISGATALQRWETGVRFCAWARVLRNGSRGMMPAHHEMAGITALKFGRSGAPHQVRVKLDTQNHTLSWVSSNWMKSKASTSGRPPRRPRSCHVVTSRRSGRHDHRESGQGAAHKAVRARAPGSRESEEHFGFCALWWAPNRSSPIPRARCSCCRSRSA